MENYSLQVGQNSFLAINPSTDFNFGTGAFTLEAWVKTVKGGTIIGHKGTEGGPGNGGFLLVANPDGTIKIATDNGFGFFEAVSEKTSITDGVWHHVAVVRQGASLYLYLDGEALTAATRGNATPPLNIDNALRLTIGTVDQQQEPNRFFSGSLAEVRIWNITRSVTDIQNWKNEKLPASMEGLVGYWAADFGLSLDFSSRRHATSVTGSVFATTDGPPVLSRSDIPCLFLFAGQYSTAEKWGGTSGQWHEGSPLYVTSSGIVVLGTARINNATFAGNTLSWPADGNENAASCTFMLNSDSSYFWPDGPQDKPLFQGWLQSPGSGKVDFRGLVTPHRRLCGVILSNSTGQIVVAGNGAPGSVLNLGDKTSTQHEHFDVYDNDTILFMATGNAVGIDGPIQAGSRLILKVGTPGGTDTKWSIIQDGTIRPKSNNDLAISVRQGNSGAMQLAAANPNDPSQKWISLSERQFIWNGMPNYVLSAGESNPGIYDKVIGLQKSNQSLNQLWYLVREAIFSEVNAYALTVSGQARAGATLSLTRYHASDAQRFTSDGQHLIHIPSGLIVKLDSNMNAVLAEPSDSSDAAVWTIAPLQEASPVTKTNLSMSAMKRSTLAEANDRINYVVYISTASTIFAGTDDRVEISLVGENQSTELVELKNSETHSDPFERGQTDRFTVNLKNVGKLKGIFFRYGENTWFGGERWVVDSVSVYDPSSLRWYGNGTVGNGAQFEMPYKTTIYFNYSYIEGGDSTMSVGKAPTQDSITRGWVDHTWVVVKDSKRTTYFDCAGTHDGPGTVNNIVSAGCGLNQAVIMATSFPIDPAHPYKPEYGKNDVTGKETCGVRASGFRNWDGQCHQMANRLLYVANPRYTLADAGNNRPAGYGLTCLLWGPYGVGFSDWCRRISISPPDTGNAIFDYIQRYLGNTNQSYKVMYHAINMQDALKGDPENPQGTDVKKFFKDVHNEGINNSTISQLVCLPEDKVEEEEQ